MSYVPQAGEAELASARDMMPPGGECVCVCVCGSNGFGAKVMAVRQTQL